jgi:hypothetical protein
MSEDETTAPKDASNTGPEPKKQPAAVTPQSTSTAQPEPEAVVLEEHIVKAAKTRPESPIKAASVAYEPKAIPPIVVPNPDPNFQPHLAPEATPPAQPEKPAPISGKPAPLPEKPLGDDIEHILATIKIPERRDFKAAADTKKYEVIVPKGEDKAAGAIVPPADPAKQPAEHASSIVAPLRTLKDDLQSIVRDKKISLVRAVTLEEEKKQGQQHLEPEQKDIRTKRSRRTMGILFAAGIFIVLGGGALFGVFYVAQEQAAVPAPPQSSILFAERTLIFSLDKQSAQNLKNALAQERTKQLGSLGSITRIVPMIAATGTSGTSQEVPATLSQFFSALGMNPPQELMSATGPQFFFGFHIVDTNAPLFVIPVTSYDHAFAGMLAWEPTMDQDLAPVFTSVSATIQVNGLPAQRTFQDEVLRNYDVRELTDDQGNVVLYYSFPTPNILVIAQSPYSFTEILSRLQAEREL